MVKDADIAIDHAVVSALLIDNGKFLLVEEGRSGREGLYNLPGGHVEPTETLVAAVVREAKEETGYDIEVDGFMGVYQTLYPHINVSVPIFSAKVVGGSPAFTDEHPSHIWVTKDELIDLADNKKIFTYHTRFVVEHYATRGVLPLDIVFSYAC